MSPSRVPLAFVRRAACAVLAAGAASSACAELEVEPYEIDAARSFPEFGTSYLPDRPGDAAGSAPPPWADAATDATAADAAGAVALDAGPSPPDMPGTAPPTAAPTEPPPADDYEFCVSETNRYRAQIGRAPVTRSPPIEAYATEGAREDHQSQAPHGHFSRTGGGGVANAENACPGWLGWSVQGSVRATIANCLALFWSEGPGGGHYENMAGPYTTVGCGWYIDEAQSITIIQDFAL